MTAAQQSDRARPRLRGGVMTAVADGSLIIDTGARRMRLSGATVPLAMEIMVGLDGQHDLDALAGRLGVPRVAVDQVVSLLERQAVIEGAPSPASAPLGRHVRAYVAGPLAAAAGCQRSDELADLLAAATVYISGPGQIARRAAADLLELGVHVEVSSPGEIVPGTAPAAVLAFDDDDQHASLTQVLAGVAGSAIPVIRFAAGPGWAEVGPVFQDGYPACPGCFRRGRQEAGLAIAAPGSSAEADRDPAFCDITAGLLAQHALALLTGSLPPLAARCVHRVTAVEPGLGRYLVTPFADCPGCGLPASSAEAGRTDGSHLSLQAILDYECQSEVLPGLWRDRTAVTDPGGPGRAEDAEADFDGASASQYQYLAYLPQRVLPRLDLADLVARSPGGLDLDEPALGAALAELSLAADGDDADDRLDGEPLVQGRAAKVEMYLVTAAGTIGIPGSAYRYDGLTDRLITVSAEPCALQHCREYSDLPPGSAQAVVVFVGNVDAATHSAGNAAFRLAHMRTGYLATALLDIGTTARLGISFASSWLAELAQVLELRPGREIITAIAGISSHPEGIPCR